MCEEVGRARRCRRLDRRESEGAALAVGLQALNSISSATLLLLTGILRVNFISE